MFSFTTPRFVPNPLAMAQIARSDILLEDVEEVAEEVAEAAKGFAPVDEGDYRDGIDTASGSDGDGVVAHVNANDWKSGLIEFGTAGDDPTPTFAPLRRGAESRGYKLEGGKQ